MKKFAVLLILFLLITNMCMTVSAVSIDTLCGKTVLCIGDSLAAGEKDTVAAPRAWAYRLQQNYGMIAINNAAVDYSFCTNAVGMDNNQYDYVVLQGGMVDIINGVPIGNVTASKNCDEFDVTTFAGGLERCFYEATSRYPQARIGFIIAYQTPNCNAAQYAPNYWRVARQICIKWGIAYLDLSSDYYSHDTLEVSTNRCISDGWKLNVSGYDLITPYIAYWLLTLQPNSSQHTSVTTEREWNTTSGHYTTTHWDSVASSGKQTAVGTTTISKTTETATTKTTTTNPEKRTESAVSSSTTIHKQIENSRVTTPKKETTGYVALIVVLSAASLVAVATIIVVACRSHKR